MQKFNYITSTDDEKASGLVNADYVAHKLANRSIGIVMLYESDNGIGFNLSDGAKIKFRLKQTGPEVVYYGPPSK
jgi:hypothetical protein